MDEIVTIDRLGDLGDGIADRPDGRLAVALAVPGDRVRLRPMGGGKAAIAALIAPGPGRVDPACRHFGRCGGCALQHLSNSLAADWKAAKLAGALRRAGLSDAPVGETVAVEPGGRRRATFAARRLAGGAILGFAERSSHQIVDIEECPAIRPEIARLLPALRTFLPAILEPRETADIAVTATDAGLDLAIIRARPPNLPDREALAGFASATDVARIVWRATANRPAEPIAINRIPTIRLGGLEVGLPPGAFLQPSAEGEARLVEAVGAMLASVEGPVVDLFCGLGTFTLPLSASRPVAGFDGDAAAIGALKAAITAAGPGRRATAGRRDLFREPLTAHELAAYAAAVLDPPRAGAEAQCRQLAQSPVTTIAMASCDPGSFARDAAILTKGGFTLVSARPIDQFHWSTHLEIVALFRRATL